MLLLFTMPVYGEDWMTKDQIVVKILIKYRNGSVDQSATLVQTGISQLID